MLALALLTAIAILDTTSVHGLIALTVPETRRLINLLILTRPPDINLALYWSLWRRRHRATARNSPYKTRRMLELSR